MAAALRQDARVRLRAQVRQEQDLAARVLAATQRLDVASSRRDTLMAAQDSLVAQRRADVADALVDYLEQAGVGLERAALILDRDKAYLARLVREQRARSNADSQASGAT